MTPEEVLRPGAAQDAVLRGVASHGYDRHPADRRGLSRDQFAGLARKDLTNGDRAIAFKQGAGENLLHGNRTSGRVIWANTSEPSKSTFFTPRRGVDAYLDRKVDVLGKQGQQPRSIDLVKARAAPQHDRAAPARRTDKPPPSLPPPQLPRPTSPTVPRGTSLPAPKMPPPPPRSAPPPSRPAPKR